MARPEATPESPGSRALVVDLIRSSGPISRTELAEATRLTQPAISLIVRKLLADAVIIETGRVQATAGKPRRLLDINRLARHGVGVQLGFDAVTLIATDTNGGVVARERFTGVGDDDPEMVTIELARQLRLFVSASAIPEDTVNAVAVVLPGPISDDDDQLIKSPTLPRWLGFPFRSRLEAALGLPVMVDNDANAAALGEFWSRDVSRYTTFACVYLSTGIGAGVVLDGSLHRGASSNAAELGHITVQPGGPHCVCGGSGCLEAVASPRLMVERALAGQSPNLDPQAPTAHNWELLCRAAIAGHRFEKDLVSESARAVAQAVLIMTNLFDLDEVVLSGPAIATAGSIYVIECRKALELAFARGVHAVDVALSANPRDSAAIGGATLTLQGQLTPGHGPALHFSTEPWRSDALG